MKIGLYGGSFNPIHNGHIRVIKYLLKKKIVDEIWIVPCKKHRFNKHLADEKDRIAMIKLAIKNIKKTRIDRIETKSKVKNCTLKTIRKLKKKYKHRFFLIIGSDILYEIKKWYKYEELIRESEFIVFKREGYSIKKVPKMKIILIREKGNRISSTGIREKISEGKPLKNLVPLSVNKYIKEKNLYI